MKIKLFIMMKETYKGLLLLLVLGNFSQLTSCRALMESFRFQQIVGDDS